MRTAVRLCPLNHRSLPLTPTAAVDRAGSIVLVQDAAGVNLGEENRPRRGSERIDCNKPSG